MSAQSGVDGAFFDVFFLLYQSVFDKTICNCMKNENITTRVYVLEHKYVLGPSQIYSV